LKKKKKLLLITSGGCPISGVGLGLQPRLQSE